MAIEHRRWPVQADNGCHDGPTPLTPPTALTAHTQKILVDKTAARAKVDRIEYYWAIALLIPLFTIVVKL